MLTSIQEFFYGIWEAIVNFYQGYSEAVHSVFPDQGGDLVVMLINVGVIALILKLVAFDAFKK